MARRCLLDRPAFRRIRDSCRPTTRGRDVNTLTATTEDKSSPTASTADDSRLWDANDVARFIGASRSWVYHQAEAGRLPCIRILGFLRFDPQVVRAFVQAASSAPATLKNRAALVAGPGDTGR